MTSTTETYRLHLIDLGAPNVSLDTWNLHVEVDEDCHGEHLGRYTGVCAMAEDVPLQGEMLMAARIAKLSEKTQAFTVSEDGLTIVPAAHLSHYSAVSIVDAIERDAWEAFRLKTSEQVQ